MRGDKSVHEGEQVSLKNSQDGLMLEKVAMGDQCRSEQYIYFIFIILNRFFIEYCRFILYKCGQVRR